MRTDCRHRVMRACILLAVLVLPLAVQAGHVVARAAASECECSAAVGHDSRECGLCLFTFLPFVDCDVAADVLATPLVEGEAAVSYLSKGYTADLRAENLRGPPVR